MPSAANQTNTTAPNNHNSNNIINNNKSNKAAKSNASVPLNGNGAFVANNKSSAGGGSNNKTANKTKGGCNDNNNNGHANSNPTTASGNALNKCKEKSEDVNCTKNVDCAESLGAQVPSQVVPSNSTKNCDNEDANNPMKLTFTTIEHKIRNLEKRKTKLETYRAIQASGKELSPDQRAAVAKYDAVINTLEFARDLVKQMKQYCKDAEKDKKKQARKDLLAKAQAETAKIREVLIIQNILSCFTDKNICNDFLNGENGAIKIELNELQALKKFYADVQTRRLESTNEQDYLNAVQKAAEIYSITIDGRPKAYGDITYEKMRNIIQRVKNCNYLNKIILTDSSDIAKNTNSVLTTAVDKSDEHAGDSGEVIVERLISPSTVAAAVTDIHDSQKNVLMIETQNSERKDLHEDPQLVQANTGIVMMQPTPIQPHSDGNVLYTQTNLKAEGNQCFPIMPVASMASQAAIRPKHSPLPGQTSIAELLQDKQQRPMSTTTTMSTAVVQTNSSPNSNVSPNPLENNYFKQQSQKFLQQIRPLAEVIGSGNYYFLQDSELDSPELNIVHPAIQQANVLFEQQQQQQNKEIHPNSLTMATVDAQVGVSASGNMMPKRNSPTPNLQAPQTMLNHIQTQTFTNQSFSQIAGKANSAGTNLPSPLFRQNQTTDNPESSLFSSTNQIQPMQQQHTLPLPLIPNLTATQETTLPMHTILPQVQKSQQQQQQQQQQILKNTLLSNKAIVDFNDKPKVAGFPFESSLITNLPYDEQIPKELINNRKIAQCLKINSNKTDTEMDITKANQRILYANKTTEAVPDWGESHLKTNTAGRRKNGSVDLRASGDGNSGTYISPDNHRNEANPWHTDADHTSAFGRNTNLRISGPSGSNQRRDDKRSTNNINMNNNHKGNRSNLSQHQHNGNAGGSNLAYNNNKNNHHHHRVGGANGPPGGRNGGLNTNQRGNMHGGARSIGNGRGGPNININASNVQHNLRGAQPANGNMRL